jgi:hypothetical protein
MILLDYPGYLLFAASLVVMCVLICRQWRFRVTVTNRIQALQVKYEALLRSYEEMGRK